MKRLAPAFALLTLLLLSACRSVTPAQFNSASTSVTLDARWHPLTSGEDNAMRRVLARAGLTPESLKFDQAFFDQLGANKFLPPAYAAHQKRPLEIPYLLAHARQGILEKPREFAALLATMPGKVGERVRRSTLQAGMYDAIKTKLSESPQPLAAAVSDVCDSRGKPLSPRDKSDLVFQTRSVPRDIQESAALILVASMSADRWQRRAFEQSGAYLKTLVTPGGGSSAIEDAIEKHAAEIERAVEQTDFAALYAGADDLALGIDQALAKIRDRKTNEIFSFDFPTPMGRVILRANDSGGATVQDSYGPGTAILLRMDLDDAPNVHRSGAANVSIDQPVSVLIDAGGDDMYDGDTSGSFQFGAGTLGYGVLIDLKGNDRYKAGSYALGSGFFGFGALLDFDGDDRYDAVQHSEGAGSFGLGLLADFGGADGFRAFTRSQGYGFTKGCGYLLDLGGGNDNYLLRNDQARFPSPQSRQHNSSLGQGCGVGRRGDMADGHNWAGGYGLLLDDGGDDTYEAAVFAQGCGYWYGMGFLLDLGGNDTYRAHWYCQGAGAHFGIGALIDNAGNDHYVCTGQMGQGAAHDWSIGWLVDADGNDLYEMGSLCGGAANANGIGVFLDARGDDKYLLSPGVYDNNSRGAARVMPADWGAVRETQLNAGIFLDCGGHDEYQTSLPDKKIAPVPGENNSGWNCGASTPVQNLPAQRGAGLDTETGGLSPVRLEPWTKAVK